jgi:hypothetical protein
VRCPMKCRTTLRLCSSSPSAKPEQVAHNILEEVRLRAAGRRRAERRTQSRRAFGDVHIEVDRSPGRRTQVPRLSPSQGVSSRAAERERRAASLGFLGASRLPYENKRKPLLVFLGFPWILSSESIDINGLRGINGGAIFSTVSVSASG